MKTIRPLLVLLGLTAFAAGLSVLSRQADPPLTKSLEDVKSVAGRPVTDVVTPQQVRTKAVAGELVVRFRDQATTARYADRITQSKIPGVYVISAAAGIPLEQQAAELAAQPGVEQALPNYVVRAALTPNDPAVGVQWALNKVDAPTAWNRTTGSASTVIASIDTGVNYNHQDFAGRSWVNAGEIAGNGLDDDNNGYKDDVRGMDFVNATCTWGGSGLDDDVCTDDADGPMDDHGHGSLTSGVFGASTNNSIGMAGLDWNAKVMAIKVLDDTGSGSLYDVAAGVRYAANNGAKVINMSLGAFGLDTYGLADAELDAAFNQGSVLVAASGNDGSADDIDYPAVHAKVIAVGATNSSDVRASFSNSAPQVSLVAPGVSVYSVDAVDAGGNPINNGYAYYSGTSLSTPHVAGVAGLLVGLQPNLSPTRVREILESSADKPSGMGGANFTNQYGYGRVNASNALANIQPYSAEFVGASSYPTVTSGTQATVYIDYRNNGGQAWSRTGANPVRLGTSQPLDRSSAVSSSSWINPHRAASFAGRVESGGSVTDTDTIAPGDVARFQFAVTGPPTGTTRVYREYFRPVVEGITWLEDVGAYWDVTVQPGTYAYSYAGATFPPTSMAPGQRAAVTLDLTNTGTATWRRDTLTSLKLGTSHPRDRGSGLANETWDSPNRIRLDGIVSGGNLTDQDSVAPGETGRFSFELTAPQTGGVFREYFEPVAEGYAWLGDAGLYFETSVPDPNAPAYDYQYLGSSTWPTLNQGGQATLKLQLRNTGRTDWRSDGPTPTRLATSRSFDRASGFYTADDGWISYNRIKLARNLTDAAKNVGGETTVAQNETAEFEFVVSANVPPGSYNEYFNPVIEGVTHLKDIGIFWKITVLSPVKVGLASQSSATFTANGQMNIRSESGNQHGLVPAGTAITQSWNGALYTTTAGAAVYNDTSPMRAEPVDPATVTTVSNLADGSPFNQYRGALMIKNSGATGTYLVNDINMEDYLRGLAEVPDSWPLEAIKAQVVAARTYAYRRVLNPPNPVFNVYDDTRSQVYNGYQNEVAKPNHTVAVGQTWRQIVSYGGGVADVYYSSDNGGTMASNQEAWGGSPLPYLVTKDDPYWNTAEVWSKEVSDATITAAYGLSGTVTSIETVEWYSSHRPKVLRFTTTGNGTVTTPALPADTHRSRMGTRSARWVNAYRSANGYTIEGWGFGHGIGLGQYGARNRALAGHNYQQILTFYFPNTGIAGM